MGILPEAAKAYIGRQSEVEVACDAVEAGQVRRYAQAIQDEDPIFGAPCESNQRFGGPVAPPLYPTHMFRRPLGAPDPIQERATDPDFDGLAATTGQTLPEIVPLRKFALLNGGSEIEFFRYARHGEKVVMVSKYTDIYERETSKGPIIFVIIEGEYRTAAGEVLCRTRRTILRR